MKIHTPTTEATLHSASLHGATGLAVTVVSATDPAVTTHHTLPADAAVAGRVGTQLTAQPVSEAVIVTDAEHVATAATCAQTLAAAAPVTVIEPGHPDRTAPTLAAQSVKARRRSGRSIGAIVADVTALAGHAPGRGLAAELLALVADQPEAAMFMSVGPDVDVDAAAESPDARVRIARRVTTSRGEGDQIQRTARAAAVMAEVAQASADPARRAQVWGDVAWLAWRGGQPVAALGAAMAALAIDPQASMPSLIARTIERGDARAAA